MLLNKRIRVIIRLDPLCFLYKLYTVYVYVHHLCHNKLLESLKISDVKFLLFLR